MLVLAGAAVLLQGCSDYWSVANFKDNPMDNALAEGTGDNSKHMKTVRDRLLKQFPVDQSITRVTQYLESVGAKCQNSKGARETVTCRYSQHMDTVFRTPFTEYLVTRRIYDFRMDLMHRLGLLRDVHVCRRITAIKYKGMFNDYNERIEYPFECLKEQNKKGK